MKRAAAIVGPTASFVRWAIRYECDLRQLDCQNLPYDTFRQLRSIREVSVCRRQHRIVDGYCIHPHFNRDVETARGFPESEVLELFGSRQQIDDLCHHCPANCSAAVDDAPTWAGCYGWFFSRNENVNWIDTFQNADGGNLAGFPESRHAWFRIWQIRQWRSPELQQLDGFLDQINGAGDDAGEVLRFHRAVKACLANRLLLVTELVPRGRSDGISWVIEPHCSICHCEMKAESRKCGECGTSAAPLPAQKRKVMGLRPYMLLTDLVGTEATRVLIKKYHSMNSDITPSG